MKVAIITGKTPGGGVGTYIAEMTRSMEEFMNASVSHYVFNTSVMTKKEIENANKKGWTLVDNTDEDKATLNSFDYVFALSHVCYKQVKEGETEAYMEFLTSLNHPKKAIFFNELNPSSIKRNYGLDYICKKDFLLSFDYILQFHNTTSSAKLIKDIVGEDEYNKRFVQLLHMYHFQDPSNWGKAEDRIKMVENLGRFVSIKDPMRLIRAKEYLDKAGYMIEMRGMIRMISLIGIPDLCYKFVDGQPTKEPSEKCFWVSKKWLTENGYNDQSEAVRYPKEKRNNMIYVFGEYDYKTVYNNVKNAAFASDFITLKNPVDYGTQTIEYAMYEFINNGMIMLADKSLGEHSYLLKNGEPTTTKFIDADSAIYLAKDLSNIDEVIEKMNYLYNNPDKYDEFRMNAYKFWKQHADPEQLIKKMFNDMNDRSRSN